MMGTDLKACPLVQRFLEFIITQGCYNINMNLYLQFRFCITLNFPTKVLPIPLHIYKTGCKIYLYDSWKSLWDSTDNVLTNKEVVVFRKMYVHVSKKNTSFGKIHLKGMSYKVRIQTKNLKEILVKFIPNLFTYSLRYILLGTILKCLCFNFNSW